MTAMPKRVATTVLLHFHPWNVTDVPREHSKLRLVPVRLVHQDIGLVRARNGVPRAQWADISSCRVQNRVFRVYPVRFNRLWQRRVVVIVHRVGFRANLVKERVTFAQRVIMQ